MITSLDMLLDRTHPSKTLDVTAGRADEGFNAFRCDRSQITEYENFAPFLMNFVIHVTRYVLRLPSNWGPDDGDKSCVWDMCCEALSKLYGARALQTAFELARTGNEGGLYRVLRDLAHQLAGQFAANEISAHVSEYWNSLTVDEQLAAAEEYLSKHGQLLPTEITEGSAARIVANMPKVLEEHPRILQRLGRVGRF